MQVQKIEVNVNLIRFMLRGKLCALILLMTMLPVGTAFGQVVTGAILGRITDSTGAAMTSAAVKVENINTGFSRTVDVDDQGQYALRNLPLGEYTVTATQAGFQTYVRRGITLTVGSEQTVNAEMTVGATATAIEVTGQASSVETTNATISGVVGSEQVRELPLNGRSIDQLALLSPGALANRSIVAVTSLGQGQRLSVNGGRMDANTYLLDGTVLNDQAGNGPNSSAGGQALGVEAILEFRLLTHNYSAEYGRSSGAIMSMVTRSGTNTFHGSLYEFLRNSAMDSRNFFNTGALPAFRRNQFGGSVGGPLKKDRFFFFFNYEGLRVAQGVPVLNLVPNANARLGLLPCATASTAPCNTATGLAQVTVNPASAPFLALYPLPNGPDLGGGTGLYSWTASRPAHENYYLGRSDYRISDKDSLYGRYVYNPSASRIPRTLPIWFDNISTFNGFLALSETHIFSSTTLNEVRAAFNRTHPADTAGTSVPLSDLPQFIPGRAFGRIAYATGGASTLGLPTSLSELGYQAPGSYQDFVQNLFQVTDSVSVVRGSHSLKFGADFQRVQMNLGNGDGRGTMQMGGITQLLAGTPSRFTGNNAPINRAWRRDFFAWFVQDDFRIKRNLTITMGLRQEFGTDPREIHNLNANLINLLDVKETIGPPFTSSNKNFAPRVGVAWDPTGSGKTSIRAGLGMYYNLWDGRNWYMGAHAMVGLGGGITVLNPPFPNPSSAINPSSLGTTYSIGAAGLLKEPTVIHYNLDIQRQLTNSLTMRVAYVGSNGYHMGRIAAGNIRIPQIINNQKVFTATSPFPNPNFLVGGINLLTADGHYNYNGLQVEVDKRLSAGLQLHMSYTYAKTMSDQDEVGNNQTSSTSPNPQDPACFYCDHSLSAYDQRQMVALNAMYNLPFDKVAQGRVMKAVIGGWAVNGIFTYGTGLPVDIQAGLNQSLNGDNSTTTRPNLNAGFSPNPVNGVTAGCAGIAAGQPLKTPARWFDPCAFSLQPAGTYGNLGRNTLIGPGLVVLDAGLIKNMTIRERMKLQFRAEAFNLLNHASFSIPSNTLFTNAAGARNTAAGIIASTSTPNRQMQMALKLTF